MYDSLFPSGIRYLCQQQVSILSIALCSKAGSGPWAEFWEENCSEQSHLQESAFLGNSCMLDLPAPYLTLLQGGMDTHTYFLIEKEMCCELNTCPAGSVTPRSLRKSQQVTLTKGPAGHISRG